MVSQRTTTSGGEKPVTAHKSHSEMKQKKENEEAIPAQKNENRQEKRNMKPRRAKKDRRHRKKSKSLDVRRSQDVRKQKGGKQRVGRQKEERERYVGDFPGPAIVNHAGP